MGWEGVTVIDLKVRFVSDYLDGYFSFSELCRQFNISRKTGYKWIHRSTFGSGGALRSIQAATHLPPPNRRSHRQRDYLDSVQAPNLGTQKASAPDRQASPGLGSACHLDYGGHSEPQGAY